MLSRKLSRSLSTSLVPPETHVNNSSSCAAPPPFVTPVESGLPSLVASARNIDDLVASYRMPPPGPDYYHARRQLWLTPRPVRRPGLSQTQHTSPSRNKLEKVLQTPGVVYSDSCWKNGIEKVWNGLCKGERLKQRLPMGLIIKVVHASWVRDDTWPAGVQVPEPDDELPKDAQIESIVLEPIQVQIPSGDLPRT